MHNIVIVGGGFGGLTTALGLEKKYKDNKNVQIILVDERAFHLFTPNLYEVAASEEEMVSVAMAKKSIVLKFYEILRNKKIQFIQGSLSEVEPLQKTILVSGKKIVYDFLVLALGSATDFYGIPGAEKYALPFKTFSDALRIRNAVEFALARHRLDVNKKIVRVVLAGGGYSGVELAGELALVLDQIAWKNQYPREKVEIEILEAGIELLPGFHRRLSKDAYGRLKNLGVKVRLQSPIVKIEEGLVELLSKERVAFDVLIWTMGVNVKKLPIKGAMDFDKKGRIQTNGFLQARGYENIFVIGDESCILDEAGKPVPSTAQDAIHQAKYLVYAIPELLQNKQPQGYGCLKHGFIVSIGGKWAILAHKNLYLKGYLGFLAEKIAHLEYYASLVGWVKGFAFLFREVKYFSRNE